MTKLWGGRFQKSAEQWVDEFGASKFRQRDVGIDLAPPGAPNPVRADHERHSG